MKAARYPFFGSLILYLIIAYRAAAGYAPFALQEPLVQNFPLEEIGAGGAVWCLAEGPDGRLYAGADRLLVYDGVEWRQYAADHTAFVRQVLVDGPRIWIGGVNEIGYFEP